MAEVRFKQLTCAQWMGADGRYSFTLFGLTEDGTVYRQTGRTTSNGEWIRENMTAQDSTPRAYPDGRKPYWKKKEKKQPIPDPKPSEVPDNSKEPL